MQFASSVSLQGGYKVVILDEADYLNPQSTQPALRGFIEEFSNNCRFILTCNFKNRIIEPLHSRCGVYEFNTSKKDLVPLAEQMLSRLKFILQSENVEFNSKVLIELILKFAPDWRRVINECQRHSISGVLNSDVLLGSSNSNVKELMDFLKNKDFKKMRGWVVNNMDQDTTSIIRSLYDNMFQYVKAHSVPQLVLILADYQYKDAFVADHELNMVACMTEIMAGVEFQ